MVCLCLFPKKPSVCFSCTDRIPMPTDSGPFVIPDCRRPGVAMDAIAIKIPPASGALLQAQADRLGTTRTALARTLIVQGLDQLAAATTTAEEVA